MTELTEEQIEGRRIWWGNKIATAIAPLAEELAFWNSEIALCDAALRDVRAMKMEPCAFLLTTEKINSLQVGSVKRLVERAKHAHYCNVYLRINGADETYEADWIKHLQLTSPPATRLDGLEEAAKVCEHKAASLRVEAAGMRNRGHEISANLLYGKADCADSLYDEIRALIEREKAGGN